VLSMGPDMYYTGPDPQTGGGQVFLVLQGSMWCNDAAYCVRSALAVTREEKAVTLTSGETGLQALVLQYPRREKTHNVAAM
jgi:non-homologous end joining protein Ku